MRVKPILQTSAAKQENLRRTHFRGFVFFDGELVAMRSTLAGNGSPHAAAPASTLDEPRVIPDPTGDMDHPPESQPSPAFLAAIVRSFHHQNLLRYAERCLVWRQRDAAVHADDLVHEALVLLLAGRVKWRGSLDQLLRSVRATIFNLSRDVRKRQRKRQVQPLDQEPHLTDPNSPDSYTTANRILFAKDLAAALDRLPAKMRLAANAYWLDGKTAAQVALECGTTEATVRKHLSRARARLQKDLKSHSLNCTGGGVL